MRILYSHYLTQADHPAVRMVQALANELREQGHEIQVHRSSPCGDATATVTCPAAGRPGKPTSWLRRKLWFAKETSRNVTSYKRDRETIRRFRPDVVLCRQDAYRVSMPYACSQARVPCVTYADAPVAYESHAVNPSGRLHPCRLVESLEAWGHKHSQAVITVSHTAAKILNRYRHYVPVAVATNGVDVHRFHPLSPAQVTAIRQELGIQTIHMACYVGTFQPFHGLALLRDTILATRDRADLTWLLVGDGNGRAELERALTGRAHVKFLGRSRQDRVASTLAASDVMMLPRQQLVRDFYFCPLKLLETMACGVTCLASDQGDIPYLLDDGRAGRVVASTETADWVQALCDLLDNHEERKLLASAARRRAETQFTWRHTAETVVAVLEDAVSRKTLRSGTVGVKAYYMNPPSSDPWVTVLRIESENLDAAFAPCFESTMMAALKRGPVIFDLEQVRFADSTGLGLLVSAARRWGNSVRMTNVRSFLRHCLRRVGSAPLPVEVGYPEMDSSSISPWVVLFPTSEIGCEITMDSPKLIRQEFGT